MNQFIKRIGLFIITNLAVMFIFSIILNILGISAQSYKGLFIFALIFGFSGSLISLFLSKKMALASIGGKIIQEPQNSQEKWFFEIVKYQSEKVQIKMPDITIYKSHDMNAFATGAFKNNALVAISSELLNKMSKDEAEAVIAHEISHIVNGDMVTMTLLQGVLNTFVIFISRVLASTISQIFANNKNNHNLNVVYYIIAPIFETVFGILASIIAMWFSRYREFHADAGSAKLVGKEKMISALKKLQTNHEPKENTYIKAFCINGNTNFKFSELLLSHPPLEKRIEALQKEIY